MLKSRQCSFWTGPPLWKPTGVHSDNRAVASHLLLMSFAEQDFKDIGGTWTGCLFMKGHAYIRKTDGARFLSLGFRGRAAIAWPLTTAPSGSWLQPAYEGGSITLLKQTKLGEPGSTEAASEEFLFLPTSPRSWLAVEFTASFVHHIFGSQAPSHNDNPPEATSRQLRSYDIALRIIRWHWCAGSCIRCAWVTTP